MIIKQIKYKKSIKSEIIKFLINSGYKIINGTLKLLQNLIFNNKNIKSAKKIIIFRTGSIGDSVCALPAIYAIRKNYPDAEIDIFTNTGKEALKETGLGAIIDNQLIGQIIDYYGITFRDLNKLIRKNRYQLLIQLPQSLTSFRRELKNLFIIKSLGFKSAIGFEITRVKIFPKWQEKLFIFKNEPERLLALLEKYKIKRFGLIYPIGIPNETKANIKQVLEHKGLSKKEKNIGMVIGAKREQNKWPIDYFDEVAKFLQLNNYNVIILGNKADFVSAQKIKGDKVFNFCGELELIETAEVLKYCKLTIANDTGPMHLSYAVGTPVIAIFSSWQQPGLWEPPADGKNIVLRNYDVHCTMCLIENCPNNICMQGIKPDKVKSILISDLNLETKYYSEI